MPKQMAAREPVVPAPVAAAAGWVVRAFTYFYDKGDYESIGDLFTEDARFDTMPPTTAPGYEMPARGRQGIVDALRSRSEYFGEVRRRHVLGVPFIVEHDARSLRCVTDLIVVHLPYGGSPDVAQVGAYHDHMVLEDDGAWRIAERHFEKGRWGPAVDSRS